MITGEPTGRERQGFDLAVADRAGMVDYLAGRGIAVVGDPVRLIGGVSGTVIKVTTEHGPLIVKQALDRLATPGEWRADRRRTVTEGRAIELLHRLTAEHTAELVDLDAEERVVIMTCAPDRWTTWKDQLLAGAVSTTGAVATGSGLGRVLARWHTAAGAEELAGFDDHQTFRALRSDPFYRAVGAVHPQLADRLGILADEVDRARGCLMHGDFSPKNVLVDPIEPRHLWVVDHEVTVDGTPVFDVAFMLSHLACKAVRAPEGPLLAASAAFLSAYRAGGRRLAPGALAAHVAALMLARVDGVSRVGYLDPDQQDRVREIAVATLGDSEPTVDRLWARIAEEGAR